MIKSRFLKTLIIAAAVFCTAFFLCGALKQDYSQAITAAPEPTPTVYNEPLPADENLRGENPADIVESAQAWCDTYSPYSYGASGSDGPGSAVDCSAFTQSVYEELGISIPRVSYDQAEVGEQIDYTPGDYSNLLPGDLVIMNNYGHCGIYAGDGMVIHASSAGGKVIKVPISSFSNSFINEIRRVIPE